MLSTDRSILYDTHQIGSRRVSVQCRRCTLLLIPGVPADRSVCLAIVIALCCKGSIWGLQTGEWERTKWFEDPEELCETKQALSSSDDPALIIRRNSKQVGNITVFLVELRLRLLNSFQHGRRTRTGKHGQLEIGRQRERCAMIIGPALVREVYTIADGHRWPSLDHPCPGLAQRSGRREACRLLRDIRKRHLYTHTHDADI